MGTRRKYTRFLLSFRTRKRIHDIHMNQGNVEKWKGDNGIWQDGGILIHFEKEENGSVYSLPSSHSHGVPMKRDMLVCRLSIVIIRGIIEKKRAFKKNALLLFYKTKTNKCRNTREQQCYTRKRNEVHIILHHFSN